MTNSLLSLLKSHEPVFWIILILEEPSKFPPPFYTARSSKIAVFTNFHTLNFCPKNQRTSPRRICYFITWHFWGSVPHKIAWKFFSPLGVTETPKNVLSPFRGTDPQKYPVSLKGYWPQKSSASLMGYWPPKMFSYQVANRPWWGVLILRAEFKCVKMCNNRYCWRSCGVERGGPSRVP